MLNFLQTIALLCQVHPATGNAYTAYNPLTVDKYQLECQQKYLKCTIMRVKTTSASENTLGTELAGCILDRVPKQ